MFHYYTPSNHQKTSDVFRGYKSRTLVENGLIATSVWKHTKKRIAFLENMGIDWSL